MITTLNSIISSLQQQQESQSDKFKKALQELIPELNTCINQLSAESVNPAYFDPKNMESEKMAELIKDLDAKMVLFNQY